MPTMPRRLPVTSMPTMNAGDQEFQPPERSSRSPSLARLAAPSIKSMAISAVASLSTSGVLVTAIPRAFAAARSTWSTPTEKLTIARRRSGSRAITAADRFSV